MIECERDGHWDWKEVVDVAVKVSIKVIIINRDLFTKVDLYNCDEVKDRRIT